MEWNTVSGQGRLSIPKYTNKKACRNYQVLIWVYDGSCLTRRNSGRKEILAFSSPNINKHKQTSFAFLHQIRGKLKRSVAGMEAWDEWFLQPEEIMILFKQDLCFYFQQKETNIYKVMQSIFPNLLTIFYLAELALKNKFYPKKTGFA